MSVVRIKHNITLHENIFIILLPVGGDIVMSGSVSKARFPLPELTARVNGPS